MNQRSIIEDLKEAFRQTNNGLVQLILINGLVFLVLLVFEVVFTVSQRPDLFEYGLNLVRLPSNIGSFAFQPWSLFTYMFAHTEFFHILFNMLFLYWFGAIITEFIGQKHLISLYVLGGVIGGLFYIAIYNLLPFYSSLVNESYLLGASAGVLAIVVGAAVLRPEHAFHLFILGRVKIVYIAIFYVIVSFAGIIGRNAGGELSHLGGAFLGYMFIKQLQAGNDLGKPLHSALSFLQSLFKRESKIKVTYRSDQNTRPSTSSRKRGAKKNTKNPSKQATTLTKEHSSKASQDEIDAILDKISEKGYDSLSKLEKQKLFNASKD